MFRRSRQAAYEEGAYDPAATPGPAGTASGSAGPVTTAAPLAAAAPAVVNPGAGASLGTVGILTVLFGAWAGIVPFVGPLFGYNANGTKAWVWNLPHALIWLAPGAVAVVMGLMMLSRAPVARAGLGGRGHIWTGLVTACCGAWLVFALVAWPVAEGTQVIRPSSAWWHFLYTLGFMFGPGCVLMLLGGIAMGLATLTRRASTVVAQSTPLRDRAIAA